MLLIQGVGAGGDTWRPQVEALQASFRCLTFDNRGLGSSQPRGEAPLTVELMALDALALLDAQGWPSAHLVGHSLGGLIAQHLALCAPQRVRSLALLNTFARGREVTRLSLRMLWLGTRTRVGTRGMRRRAFLELILPRHALRGADRDALAAALAPVYGHDLADQPPVTGAQLDALGRYDSTPRLAELAAIPTLVVSADEDPIARPELGRALAAGIPGARWLELSAASHALPVHEPERVNAPLLEHLRAVERARAATSSA